jgi:hypothetical protein
MPTFGRSGTRIWPNVITLPEGYPSHDIALMMDRINFPRHAQAELDIRYHESLPGPFAGRKQDALPG